jgi:hypothetical protein
MPRPYDVPFRVDFRLSSLKQHFTHFVKPKTSKAGLGKSQDPLC